MSELTWADGQTTVNNLTTDRSRVRGDYSVGVHAVKGEAVGRLTVYAGGWFDFEYWSGETDTDLVVRAPGWNDWLDLTRFRDVLDRFEALLLRT